MQRTVLPRSFCPFVRLSLKHVNCDKMKETCALILIPHERPSVLVFWQEERWVGATHSSWKFGPNWPCWSENADFQLIFARSASAVTPTEKSSASTNRKSTTRFPKSLRWTSYVATKPTKGAQKRKTAVLPVNLHFSWRKYPIKFICVNTASDRVVRHSLAYLSVQTWFAGDVPYYVEIWLKLANPPPSKNADFQSIFSRSALAVTPSEKSSINTNRKSTTSFLMNLRWTVYVVPKPQGEGRGSRTQVFLHNLIINLR